jgi:nucleoside-diphosphate-sugar epimerase
MKILVTGGAGAIGSNLVHRPISKGHQVLNIDKTPTRVILLLYTV